MDDTIRVSAFAMFFMLIVLFTRGCANHTQVEFKSINAESVKVGETRITSESGMRCILVKVEFQKPQMSCDFKVDK